MVPLTGAAATLGLCCGFPLLTSVGVVGVVSGIGLGSWMIAGVASAVVPSITSALNRPDPAGWCRIAEQHDVAAWSATLGEPLRGRCDHGK